MAIRVKKKRRRAEEAASIPVGFRGRLESYRLGLLALFRALDHLLLAQDQPPDLRALFELDADLAEALWVLDQPIGRFDLAAMVRDTLASFAAIPHATDDFLDLLSAAARAELIPTVHAVRASLPTSDAYLQIRGRDPAAP